MGNCTFEPNTTTNREQIATMTTRAEKQLGAKLGVSNNVGKFSDSGLGNFLNKSGTISSKTPNIISD